MSWIGDLITQFCPSGVPFLRLGNVARIRNGSDYKHLGEGDVPVYGSGGVMTSVNAAVYVKPSVLIPRKGSLDKLYYVDVPFWTVDTMMGSMSTHRDVDFSSLPVGTCLYVTDAPRPRIGPSRPVASPTHPYGRRSVRCR